MVVGNCDSEGPCFPSGPDVPTDAASHPHAMHSFTSNIFTHNNMDDYICMLLNVYIMMNRLVHKIYDYLWNIGHNFHTIL